MEHLKKKNLYTTIWGNFIAKIEKPENNDKQIEKFDLETSKNRGNTLIDFGASEKLHVMLTFLQNKSEEKMDVSELKW